MDAVVSKAAEEIDYLHYEQCLGGDATKKILERVYIAGRASANPKLKRSEEVGLTLNLLEKIRADVGSPDLIAQTNHVLTGMYNSITNNT